MALHKTQCPHCFTRYVISDSQLRVSEGMVRCGTCRERFQARLIDEVETPRFDPRDAFIEPLSGDAETSVSEIVTDIEKHLEPVEIEFADPHTESEPQPVQEPQSVKDSESEHNENTLSVNPSTTVEIDTQANASRAVTQASSDDLSAEQMLANIQSRQKREAQRQRELAEQQELSLNAPSENPPSSMASSASQPGPSEAHELIDEVDSLVDGKLASDRAAASNDEKLDVNALSENQVSLDRPPANQAPFDLAPNVRKKGRAWLFVPPLFILIILLGLSLSYQLWIKQLIYVGENTWLHTQFIKLVTPLSKELEKRDINLPVRRNLSQMELLAARTEPHPTRSSTTLLKVAIVNRADISQPLPWLEMSLSDADGRLISRRNLSPNDYMYNNNSLNQIGAKELKKITIELLAFPKQATGYELKLLNR